MSSLFRQATTFVCSLPVFSKINPKLALATFAIGLAMTQQASATDNGKLPVKQLTAGMFLIQAEVANTDAARQRGLMMRSQMGNNEGMVFDFGEPAAVCMWMKNTLIPLSVAFIDVNGQIINIEDMQPQTLESHCAKKPVRYALEMNQGWFKQKNIQAGFKIGGLDKLR